MLRTPILINTRTLSGLTDTEINSPVNGEFLVFNGTDWVNSGATGVSGSSGSSGSSGTNGTSGSSGVNENLTGVGVSKITVGTTEPTSPSVGDLWVDTN